MPGWQVLAAILGAWLLGAAHTAAAPKAVRHAAVISATPDLRTIHCTNTISLFGHGIVKVWMPPWFAMTALRVDGKPANAASAGGSHGLHISLPGRRRHWVEISGQFMPPEKGHDAQHRLLVEKDWLYLPPGSLLPWIDGSSVSYRLTVEVPLPFRAVATGTLVSEETTAELNRATFTAENALEPPSIFAGRYVVGERISGSLRLRTYFTASTATLSDAYLDAADHYIRRFSEEIGPHPFTDFHMVAAPLPVGLGFPGLTYIDQRILPLPFVRERSLGHEVLHDWWGNGVVPDYEHGNWSEGLTTYMADYAFAATRDPKDAVEMRIGWLRDFTALPFVKDIPVVRFVSRTHDASQIVGYGKTAYIFHMLKSEVGEERFKTAIRRFWQEYKGREAGWQDIRRVFEAEAGRDLAWFFDQWMTRTGAPTLSLGDAKVTPQTGGYQVEITLKQAAAPWRLTVPLDIVTETGTEHIRVPLSGAEDAHRATVTARPLAVRVDPEYTLFRRLLPGEAPPILRDVLLDEGARAIVADNDPAMADAAREVAGRLFEAKQPVWVQDTAETSNAAFIIIGTPEEVTRLLAKPGMPTRPAALPSVGSARVWTAARENGKPLLVIEAANADALRSLSAPLPHSRNKSYLAFDGRRAIAHGVWPPNSALMEKRF